VRGAVAVAWPALKPFQNTPWHVGVQMTNAAAAQAANVQFRSKDYVPDVLSFPLWEGGYAGDILLCWPTLKAAAQAQGKPLKAHVQHLVIHSLLHVAGYDHQTPTQARSMEALETKLLAVLGWPDPYIIG
jgi:probable rRNA maturation factor